MIGKLKVSQIGEKVRRLQSNPFWFSIEVFGVVLGVRNWWRLRVIPKTCCGRGFRAVSWSLLAGFKHDEKNNEKSGIEK